MATATARAPRTSLPKPTTDATTREDGHGGEVEAINAIEAAYLALNAASGQMAWENNSASPMALVSKAAVAAIGRLPGVSPRDARIIWDGMRDGGSGFGYVYDMWVRGEI